jgi:hypothetical protein
MGPGLLVFRPIHKKRDFRVLLRRMTPCDRIVRINAIFLLHIQKGVMQYRMPQKS